MHLAFGEIRQDAQGGLGLFLLKRDCEVLMHRMTRRSRMMMTPPPQDNQDKNILMHPKEKRQTLLEVLELFTS